MKGHYIINFIILILFVCLGCEQPVSNHSASTGVNTTNSNKNTQTYWKARGYQVFPQYQFAIDAPVTLKNVNDQSSGNFDLHYGEFDGNRRTHKGTYYEIIAFDIPGFDQFSGVDQREQERRFLERHTKGEGDDLALDLVSGKIKGRSMSYMEQGRNAKGFAFIHDGSLFALNVISDFSISPLFDEYVNSIVFYGEIGESNETTISKEVHLTENKPSMNQDFSYYKSRSNQIKIGYPKHWREVSYQGVEFAAIDEKNNFNFNIVILRNERRSLESVTKGNRAELQRNIKNLEIISESRGTINNNQYTSTLAKVYNPSISAMMYTNIYCFVKNKRAYIISFSCEYIQREEFSQTIKKILETIEL